MWAPDPYADSEVQFRSAYLRATLISGAVIAAIFITFPSIDLRVSEILRGSCTTLSGKGWCNDGLIIGLRYAFICAFVVVCVSVLVGLLVTIYRKSSLIGLSQSRWLLLALSLGVGPGLVANTLFKDNWGRARPHDVVELGGTKAFSPPLVMTRDCLKNCSFFSGEASATFVAPYAAALVIPQYRAALIVGGTIAGLIAGFVRMIQGAHFLSDVLFAAVFMALTTSLLHAAVIGVWRPATPTNWKPYPWPESADLMAFPGDANAHERSP